MDCRDLREALDSLDHLVLLEQREIKGLKVPQDKRDQQGLQEQLDLPDHEEILVHPDQLALRDQQDQLGQRDQQEVLGLQELLEGMALQVLLDLPEPLDQREIRGHKARLVRLVM